MLFDVVTPKEPVVDLEGAPLYVEMQRQPILKRRRLPPAKGKTRGKYQTVRTLAPTMVRRVLVVEWTERSRVVVMYGMVPVKFSVSSGRATGLPDWILSAESHQQLRQIRRQRFRVARQKKEAPALALVSDAAVGPSEDVEDLDEVPPADAAPPEPVLEGPKPTKTEGPPKASAKVLVRVWCETKGVLTLDDALPESDVSPTQLSSTAAYQCVYEKLGRVMESTSVLERRAFVDQDRTVWTLFSVHERDTSELDSAGRGRWMQWEELLERVPWYDAFEIGHATVEPEE